MEYRIALYMENADHENWRHLFELVSAVFQSSWSLCATGEHEYELRAPVAGVDAEEAYVLLHDLIAFGVIDSFYVYAQEDSNA